MKSFLAKCFVLLSLAAALCSPASENQNKNQPASGIGLKAPPAVFAVGKEYQIMVAAQDTLVRIRIDGRFYSDQVNGVRPSVRTVHRFRIPMEVLDKAGKYEVFCRKLPNRLAYLHKTKPEPETSQSFNFRKIPEKDIRIYHLSDTHSRLEIPVKTALASGRIDLLVLNGDIMDTASGEKQLEYPCIIAGEITRGGIPAIYTRGNHELRGKYAEFMPEFTPNDNGRFYYTVRLGPIWALILDFGEDKADEHPAYGYTIECVKHRQTVLDFMKKVIAGGEFNDPGIRYKLVICHVPFSRYIGKDGKVNPRRKHFSVITEWCRVLRTGLKPDLTICGHVHRTMLLDSSDIYPCPVIVGSRPGKGWDSPLFTGASIELKNRNAVLKFMDQNGKAEFEKNIPFL